MSQIEELRQIIVGADSEKLADLKNRIESVESRTKDVLEVLPPAINAGIKKDDSLIQAFEKPVSESLKRAIRAEPEAYAQILYPVMGPSIRQAISQAISSLMITINQTIESATSAEGLKLRIQSMRTGVPYAELALMQSLRYKVEHIYLIDRDSGMMIAEVAGVGSNGLDSDAVSAMFSAIQSFVQDSFSNNDTDRLTDFKVGGHKVWITHGPKVMLASVIYGEAPETLKTQLYDVLDNLRTDYSQEFNEFSGDSSTFVGIEDKLKPLLQMQHQDETSSSAIKNKPSFAKRLLLLALMVGIGYLIYSWINQKTKLDTVEKYLRDVPGLFITNAYWEDDKIIIEGLKDAEVVVPYSKLQANNIDKEMLLFKTNRFRSLDPEIEKKRLLGELSLPEGLSMEVSEGRLYLQGRSNIEWLLQNDSRIRQLVSQDRIDASNLYVSLTSLRQYSISQKGKSNEINLNANLLDLSNTPWLLLFSKGAKH